VAAAVVCLGVLAWAVPTHAVSSHHAGDETEVFTGSEEVAGGGATRTPTLTYWRVRAALTVGAFARPARVGLLLPLSDGRQDVLMRRVVAPGWRFEETGAGPNLRAQWSA